MKRNVLLVIGALALAGCATSDIPRYANYDAPNSAAVSGETASIFKFWGGVSHIYVSEIDGVSTGFGAGGTGPYLIKPGTHQLGITTVGNGYTIGKQYIEVTLLPNHRYHLNSTLIGISFHVLLKDVTNEDSPQNIAEYKIRSESRGGGSVPIFIPVAR